MKLVFLLKSMEGFLSSQVVPASGVFRAANHSTLEAWITISIWKRTPGVRFLFYKYFQDQKYVLSVFQSPVLPFEYILEAQIPISIWKRTPGVRFLFYRYSQDRTYVLSVFQSLVLTFKYILEVRIPMSIWKRTSGVRFLSYRYCQDWKYVLSVFQNLVPPIDMGRPMSVRSESGRLTWGVPCQCVEKYFKLLH